MPSITIPLPDNEVVQRFCSQHTLHPVALFQLSWALVQHCYFDTDVFLLEQTDEHSQRASATQVVNFVSEFASKSVTLTTLKEIGPQQPQNNAALFLSSADDVDTSLLKIWSKLQYTSNGYVSEKNDDVKATEARDFDLQVIVHEKNKSHFDARLEYSDTLTETRDLNDIARNIGHILSKIVRVENNATIDDIGMLSEHDFRTIIERNAEPLVTIDDCLHKLIEKSVIRNPDSVALVSWDGSLTYSELNARSSILANHLVKTFGIIPETVIPLCFEKSIWAVVAMLAVLKAGAAYCYLDPAHPQARRNFMVELVDAKVVLCSPIHSALIQNCTGLVIDAELINSLLDVGEASFESPVKPTNACIIQFTSGTTGTPKALIHSHISICSGLAANAPQQNINRNTIRLFQWAAYTFDVSITETFGPLIYGGVVCIPSEDERLNNVEESMIRMNVDWAYFTPTFARFFRRFTIPCLKQLILGGEAVTVDDVRDWADKIPVLNAYGPSEAITWFLEPQDGVSSTISIGRPINMKAWIADPEDHNRLMPVGAIGELLIEGPSIFRHYIKNQEKTDQVLINPPPWRLQTNLEPGSKMYKSGDLVRYLPNGTMTYIGRKDTMVKLFGQRMELEEVETILRRNLPDTVLSSADVIRPAGENEDPVLVAFLSVTKGYSGPNMQELKIHLQNELVKVLATFMVPRIYIPVESMPYNSSRKLDRAKLRQGVAHLTRNQLVELIEPKRPIGNSNQHILSDIEESIRKLWAETLSLEPEEVGPDDNFFSLGGSSVSALNVIATAKTQGIKILYSNLFRAPTLRSLAATVSRTSDTPPQADIARLGLIQESFRAAVISDAINQCQVPLDMIEDIYPLAPQQQGLWAVSLTGNGGDYVAQFILTLNADIDVDKFRTAWSTVVEMLPTLRTRFIESASGSYQVVLKGDVHWHTSTNLKDYLHSDIQPDLAFGSPLVRQALIREEEGTNKVVWTMHHGLFDGESVPLFLNTVARAYQGISPNPVSGPFNHFIKYVHDLDDDKEASTYWQSQFDEITPIPYPALPKPNYRPNPSSVYRGKVRIARRLGSTITTATILRAALGLTVAKLAKSWDAIVGVTLAGRTAPVANIESIVGPTFVTLPTRISQGAEASVESYLHDTQSSIVEMIPFEHTGMQKIAEYSAKCNQACHFQTLCLVQTPEDRSYTSVFKFDDTTGGFGRFNSHALMVLFFTNKSGVEIVYSYDPAIINDEQLVELNDDLETIIHVLCLEEKDRQIASILPFPPKPSDLLNGSSTVDETKQVSKLSVKPRTSKSSERTLTEMEKFIALAWSEVFKLPDNVQIDVEDDFFENFGGNSLLSLRLSQHCRENGIRITVKDIFQNPRLADMASAASQIATNGLPTPPSTPLSPQEPNFSKSMQIEAASACGVPVNQITDIYPSTALQEGLLSLSVNQPGSYVSQTVYHLANDIDLDRFRDSWSKIYSEEEILRTRLFQPSTESTAYQAVLLNKIDWGFVPSLSAYMDDSNRITMGFGNPLSKFAIIQDDSATYFVLTIHHALYDGWSLPVLIDRVFKTYFAPTQNTVRTPFKMFIEAINSGRPTNTTEYWKSELKDANITHFPRALLATESRGQQVDIERSISIPTSRPTGIFTSTVLRAAWALLLSTYVKGEDVIFGATLSGRNVPLSGIETVVGPTLTTVPIRIKFTKSEETGAFLKRVQEQSHRMIDYEHTGLQHISKLAPDACNFQNLLVLQPRGEVPDHSNLWTSENVVDKSGFFNYPLVVQCIFGGNDKDISIIATFDESRIPTTQMNRIISQYQTIIVQLCNQENATLDELNMLSPEDFSDLQKWISESPAPEDVDSYLHDQILKQVNKHPDSIALSSSWEPEISYGVLHKLSSDLAAHLVELGTKPGFMIPVIFDKSIFAVVAMLAVLMSGSAFVPIDPESPRSRQDLIFDQIDASVILASPKYTRLISRGTVLGIDHAFLASLSRNKNQMDKVPPMINNSTANPAYVLFTSGSTGVPKGVVISHRAVCSSTNAHGKSMGFNKETRTFQFCSYTFDVSIAEIFTTLVFGGTVCVPSPSGRLDDLAKEMSTMRVNWSFLTPTVAKLLGPSDVPTLKTLVLGGEEVGSGDVSRWSNSELRLINGYGPTEACIFCVSQDILSPTTAGTIGRPIGCNGFIVDPEDTNKLAPIGTVGELLVTGPILATGYLADPARSNASFINSPTWASSLLSLSSSSQAFYKTGDIVRYNHCGEIEYMSRKDTQVKVRGLRIEVEDIEHWILKDSQVKHALVLPMKAKQEQSADQLVAIVSLLDSAQPKSLERPLSLVSEDVSREHLIRIRDDIEQHLPLYAVPNAWICVNEIPLSSSNKISRKETAEWFSGLTQDQLKKATAAGMDNSQVAQTPKGELEESIMTIWSSVLDIPSEQLVSNRSFLRYGGDSISAIRVVKESRKVSINFTVKDLLLAKGISDLARIVNQNDQDEESSSTASPSNEQVITAEMDILKQQAAKSTGLPVASIERVTKSTPLQENMLGKSEAGFYNLEMIFKIQSSAPIDIPRLRKAWYQVMERHSALRTIFTRSYERRGKHDQVILSNFESTLIEGEVRDDASTLQFRPQVSRSRIYESNTPHHRLTVHKTLDGNCFMKLEFSHAITDAVSLAIVFRNLELAYDGSTLSPYTHIPQAFQYQTQLWEQAESDQSYWQQYCAELSPCQLPCLAESPSDNTKLLYAAVQQPDVTAVVGFCKQSGILVTNLVHAIWALSLRRHLPVSDEVVFGYVVSGRDMDVDGIENMVGALISTLIARYKLENTTTLIQFLEQVRDDTAKSSGRNYCNVAQIESQLGVEKKLFNTMINYRKQSGPSSDAKSPTKFEYLRGFDPWACDIMLTIDELDNQLKLQLAYLNGSIDVNQAEEIASDFSLLLNFVLEHSDESIGNALTSLKGNK